jgi:hypothetical protein
MRKTMPRHTLRLGAVLVVFFGTMQTVHAQLYSAEIQRGLMFPGTRAYDGEPTTQRYSYATWSPLIYVGGNVRNLYYMDYLDRADRAAKFGYRMPVDPFFPEAPVMQTPEPIPAPVRGGFGFFHRR